MAVRSDAQSLDSQTLDPRALIFMKETFVEAQCLAASDPSGFQVLSEVVDQRA